MTKVINKNTKVVKDIKNEIELSMYISTGEWEILKTPPKKEAIKPLIYLKQ